MRISRANAGWIQPQSRYAMPPPAPAGSEGAKLIDEWVKLRVAELQDFYRARIGHSRLIAQAGMEEM